MCENIDADSSHPVILATSAGCKPSNTLLMSMEEGVKKHGPLHRDLAKTRMKRDTEAIALALRRIIHLTRIETDLLVSFSTGFTSTANDAVNAERVGGRCRKNWMDSQRHPRWKSSSRYRACRHSERFPR